MKQFLSFSPKPLSLFGAICFALLLGGCRGQLSPEPPIHLNPNMDHQKRFEAQEENLFFQDGRAMRPLIEGTVARGFLREESGWYKGQENGQDVKKLPSIAKDYPKSDAMKRLGYKAGDALKLDAALLARGQERYNIFCTPCHGYSGDGKGIVTKYSKALIPQNLQSQYVREMPVGQIYRSMANGVGANMPAFNSQVDVFDRWAIVAYVRALQLTRRNVLAKQGESK